MLAVLLFLKDVWEPATTERLTLLGGVGVLHNKGLWISTAAATAMTTETRCDMKNATQTLRSILKRQTEINVETNK